MNENNLEHRRSPINALVEGAVLAAIATILGLVGLFLPPLSLLTNFLWPIPLIVLCLRHDLRTGILAFIVTTLLLMMFATPFRGLSLALEFGIMSLIYGLAFKKNWPVGRTVFYGALAAVTGTVLVIGLSILLVGFSLDQMRQEMMAMLDTAIEMYRQMGILDRMAQQGMTEEKLRAIFSQAAALSISLIPGVMIVSSLATALASFLLSRIILRKMRISLPAIPPFTTWRLPWYFIWGFILGLGSLLLGDYYQIDTLKLVGQNVLAVYFPVFFLIGLAILKFYMQKFNLKPVFRLAIAFVVLMYLPVAAFSLAFLGMFDTLFDYRKLGQN
ncbi:YybS family protein [Zhaonella formicivorans]|uniref:YybS family protein n=1 Tax=Zhaonella formicivorans TaxID=2528593 RepID=UPI001D0FABFC|nr:YybS family protein [Zhaonella formicivorans]